MPPGDDMTEPLDLKTERERHVHQLRSESCLGSPGCLVAFKLDQIERARRAAAALETALRADSARGRELLQACEARLRAEAETIAGLTVQRDIARESLQVVGTRLQAWPIVLRWHWPDLVAAYDMVARRSGLVVVCQCGASSEPAPAKATVTAWWVGHVCAVGRGEGPAPADQADDGHTQDVASALSKLVDDLETALEAERVELANARGKVAELERHADILVKLRRGELDWTRRQRDSERERSDRLQADLDAAEFDARRVAAVVDAAKEWRLVWSVPTHDRLRGAIDALDREAT